MLSSAVSTSLKTVKIPSRFTDEGNVAAVQVGNDTVEVIGDEGASGASLALFGNAVSVAEHEVIDEELRGERVCPEGSDGVRRGTHRRA
jgi:hypothetical protein